jgi:hypothetical protein
MENLNRNESVSVLVRFIEQRRRLAVERQHIHMLDHECDRQCKTDDAESEPVRHTDRDRDEDHRPHRF